MKTYNYTVVVRKSDLDVVNILKDYFDQKVKVEIIGKTTARVTLTERSADPYKRMEEILVGIDLAGLPILTYGIQCEGQTILIK